MRLLVGFPPGGGMDTIARVMAPKLAESLGQPFVVENRPGAARRARRRTRWCSAAPDGYVLLLAESGTLIVPAMNPKAAYDPVKQFAPVGGVCSLPLAFVEQPVVSGAERAGTDRGCSRRARASTAMPRRASARCSTSPSSCSCARPA